MKRTQLKRKTPLRGHRSHSKPRKRKKPTITLLKKKLWKLTREIIIKRYGNNCYTCPNSDLSGSGLHCGHFISSSVCSVEMRYDLGNLRPQCYACNIHRSGNWPAFERHLIADGIDVEALKQRNEDTKGLSYRIDWFEAKIQEYTTLLESL